MMRPVDAPRLPASFMQFPSFSFLRMQARSACGVWPGMPRAASRAAFHCWARRKDAGGRQNKGRSNAQTTLSYFTETSAVVFSVGMR